MMGRKFTDDEIVKALECCFIHSNCTNCPLEIPPTEGCLRAACTQALDLINRKKAEIDRLTVLAELGNMRANDYRAMRDKTKNARADGIKEFAERLKQYCVPGGDFGDPCGVLTVTDRGIDYLVKEMTGEKNGN